MQLAFVNWNSRTSNRETKRISASKNTSVTETLTNLVVRRLIRYNIPSIQKQNMKITLLSSLRCLGFRSLPRVQTTHAHTRPAPDDWSEVSRWAWPRRITRRTSRGLTAARFLRRIISPGSVQLSGVSVFSSLVLVSTSVSLEVFGKEQIKWQRWAQF